MTLKPSNGCVIAAPQSGSGKTLVTLGLLRALGRLGVQVKSAKVGPDYIDPAFHARASGSSCVNLDLWAMGEARVCHLASTHDYLLVEGVMGLFDGADNGYGSTADLAACLNLPVVMVVDARSQSFSAAALLHGFKSFRGDVDLAGVIFNRVGSERHAGLLRRAAEAVDVPVLGCLPRVEALTMPSRHLGLVQAEEHGALETLIEQAADLMAAHVDLEAIAAFQGGGFDATGVKPLAPLGQRIVLARDEAFSFTYAHMIDGWRAAGAEILPFSPLNNEAPDPSADAVFLSGGYPELHAGKLASNAVFLDGLRALNGEALIYGECGGFMVMGDVLIDGDGVAHEMAGLLPVTTSFEQRTRHLGYRRLTHKSVLPWPETLRGHEFHYSTLIAQGDDAALFMAENAMGDVLDPMGLSMGKCVGSYAHVIAPEEGS